MSYQKTKVDDSLGFEIEQHLRELGVNTPTIPTDTTRQQKIDIIEDHVRGILETIGLDLTDDSLMDTPKRVAKMYVNEIFWGLDSRAFPKCTAVENKMGYNSMVLERGITVSSFCEHHFQPIWGKATVAYIPDKRVLGLSKMNRIVEYFSRRPQVQERLTEQIAAALKHVLKTPDVGVVIDAEHFCVKCRGVEDTGSSTVTSRISGDFMDDPQVRMEFLSLANHKH